MPRTYSMATRAGATAAAQEQILHAAVDELLAFGGEGFTMQGVARRADVALRTLYNHFPTRDKLLAAAFGQLATRTRGLVAGLDPGSGSLVEQLRQFVERIYQLFEDEGESLGLLLGLRGIPELDAVIAEIRAWRRERLTAMLQAVDADETLAVPLEEAVALAFVVTAHATWHSLAVQSGLGTPNAQRLAGDTLTAMILGVLDDAEGTASPAEPR